MINGIQHLVLCYINATDINCSYLEREQKKFLVYSFFEACDKSENQRLSISTLSEAKGFSLNVFYDRLKRAHLNDDLETGISADVQHRSLRPCLRSYQKKGIKWMLKRELQADYLPTGFIKLRSKFNKNQIFHYNTYSQYLLIECPEQKEMPRGGLLTGDLFTFEYITNQE